MFKHPWGTSEDDLTSDFFGLMKYLPSDVLLIPFLNMIQNLYPDRKISTKVIESAEILLWPEYQIPNKKWQYEFNRPDIRAERRRSKYYIVPDVVISFNNCILVVEAEKSHSVEAEQLFQQYMIAKHYFPSARESRGLFNLLINIDQMPPSFCGIPNETQTEISPSDSIPKYIVKRAVMLGEQCDIQEVRFNYLWISWHHVGKLAEEVLNAQMAKVNEISKLNTRFLAGFKEMMDKEGFYPVPMFRCDESYKINIDTIPILKRGLDFDIIGFKNFIEPSLIPVLKKKQITSST